MDVSDEIIVCEIHKSHCFNENAPMIMFILFSVSRVIAHLYPEAVCVQTLLFNVQAICITSMGGTNYRRNKNALDGYSSQKLEEEKLNYHFSS